MGSSRYERSDYINWYIRGDMHNPYEGVSIQDTIPEGLS